MKMILHVLALSIFATSAFAHATLQLSTPANGAVLQSVPPEVALIFTGKIRLTRVEVYLDGKKNEDIALDALKGFAANIALPLTDLGPGTYELDWRALGTDGHAMTGGVSFTVK
ncbi:copper resistance CopC family protein [Sulfitobacter sp. SK012]|uniref:copper resistance CopC family protein n=1 Tax=Sulfitobacter sp. SK012 TaxID=1389005 RepID=UPI0013B44741|nr:copper resistance CopC family protein [Sulfitobacter sp. SK012]